MPKVPTDDKMRVTFERKSIISSDILRSITLDCSAVGPDLTWVPRGKFTACALLPSNQSILTLKLAPCHTLHNQVPNFLQAARESRNLVSSTKHMNAVNSLVAQLDQLVARVIQAVIPLQSMCRQYFDTDSTYFQVKSAKFVVICAITCPVLAI